MGVKIVPQPPYSPDLAVVMRQVRRWKRLWRRSLTRWHTRTSRGPSRSCWNGTTSELQPEEFTSKGSRVSCVYYQWKCPYEKKSWNLSYAPLSCTIWTVSGGDKGRYNFPSLWDRRERKSSIRVQTWSLGWYCPAFWSLHPEDSFSPMGLVRNWVWGKSKR